MTLTATVSRTTAHAGLLRVSRVTLRSPAPFRSIRGPGAVRMAKNNTLTVALSQDELKKQAAHKAVEYAKSGMVLGLGTGSTTAFAIDRIGELMKKGDLKDIVGVPTSIKSFEQASGGWCQTQSNMGVTGIAALLTYAKLRGKRFSCNHVVDSLVTACSFGYPACYPG